MQHSQPDRKHKNYVLYTKLMPQKHKIRHTGPNTPRLCGGKRSYATKSEAEIVKAEQEIITPDLSLSVYRCLQCTPWHLTRSQHRRSP